ncbi:MAG: hypothetical protein RLO48_02080 [Bauldia litoralis]
MASLLVTLALPALAADERACAAALDSLDAAYEAAVAVEQNADNAVFRLMPAALAAEKAADQAQLGDWPAATVRTFESIAVEARDLAATPEARTPEAARTLRGHADTGEAEIAPICGGRNRNAA